MKSPNINIFTKDGDWVRTDATIYCDNEECRYHQPPEGEEELGRCGCDKNQFVINPDNRIECSVMFE